MTRSPARLFTLRRVVVGAGLLVLIALVVFAVQAVLAVRALSAARTDATVLARDLAAGNLQPSNAEARSLASHARAAHSAASGPLWWIGAHVPWLGKNVAAVQDTAAALDVIASRTMPVLLKVAGEAEHGSLRPHNGRMSPSAIAALAPEVQSAADALRAPAEEIASIDTSSLLGPLRPSMRQVQSRVHEAQVTITAAADAFRVLPGMLGGHGSRRYLLVVQNPAEIRAAGGLAGTWAILNADRGRLSLTHASTAATFDPHKQAVRPTAEEAALFGTNWGLAATDSTQSPDFSRDAQMAANMAAQQGLPVSGVFTVDPIALSEVLKGTGPVRVTPQVTLTSSNAVEILLNRIYRTMDGEQQNAFFALAAEKIFHALVSGQGNQLSAIRGLVEGVSQNRVLVWSSDPEVARVVAGTNLAGAFPRDAGATPNVGLYLNDAVPGKQEYYLRQTAQARSASCRDGVQTIALSARFTSTMPRNPARTLPIWVVGLGDYSPKGHMLMGLYLAGPWKGSIEAVTVDGKPVTVTSNQLDGRQIAIIRLALAPGQTVSVTATMRSGPGQTGAGRFTRTPGMDAGTDPTMFRSTC